MNPPGSRLQYVTPFIVLSKIQSFRLFFFGYSQAENPIDHKQDEDTRDTRIHDRGTHADELSNQLVQDGLVAFAEAGSTKSL